MFSGDKGNASASADVMQKLRGRAKPILIVGAVVVAAMILGPYFIKNNEFLNHQYNTLVQLKDDYFSNDGDLTQMGAQYVSRAAEEKQEDVADVPDGGMASSNHTKEAADQDEAAAPLSGGSTGNDGNAFVSPITQTQEKEGSGSMESTGNSTTTNIPDKFDDSTFPMLFSNPKRFAGYEARLSGRIYETAGDHDTLVFRMYSKAESDDGSYKAAVFFQAPEEVVSKFNLETGDCTVADGIVREGSLSDRNSFGDRILIPIIDATDVQEIACVDFALPAEKTIWPNQSQTINGVTITIERVQFSQEHTRALLKVADGRTSGQVYLRGAESVAIQGEDEYRGITDNPDYNGYMVDPVLVPQGVTSGYLFFQPVKDSTQHITFRIILEEVKVTGNIQSTFIIKI